MKTATTKTNVAHETRNPSTTGDTAHAPGSAPPSTNAPATPAWWKPAKKAKRSGKLKKAEIENMASSGDEMAKSSTYVEDFGTKAPEPQALATTLATAATWRESWAIAKKWLAYCADQRGAWEEAALAEAETLKPAFDYAASRDESIAKKYPATKQLLGARSDIAKRGGASRAKAKAAKAQAAAAPAAAPGTNHTAG